MSFSKKTLPGVGDIFRTISTARGSRYIQLVALDRVNLNSDVVVVFADSQEIDQDNCDVIAKQPIEFYVHTNLSAGSKQGLWEKNGHANVLVELKDLKFKHYRGHDEIRIAESAAARTGDKKYAPPFHVPYWSVWTPEDDKFTDVDEKQGLKIEAEWGAVVPPSALIARIASGQVGEPKSWPK